MNQRLKYVVQWLHPDGRWYDVALCEDPHRARETAREFQERYSRQHRVVGRSQP